MRDAYALTRITDATRIAATGTCTVKTAAARVDRLHAVNTERSISPKRCFCSAAPTSGPSPQNTSTCPGLTIETSGGMAPGR
jgi:hypothetical protein